MPQLYGTEKLEPMKLFDDHEVQLATGIGKADMERLITMRAVIPEQAGGGRGRIRLWGRFHLSRFAVLAAFRKGGFSLNMATTMTFLHPGI